MAARPVSNADTARFPSSRTPIRFQSPVKTIGRASPDPKSNRPQSKAFAYKTHSGVRANLPAPSFNPASMSSASWCPHSRAAALTEASRFPKGRESDSTCWLGLEASWHGASLFFGPAGAGGWGGGGGSVLPLGGQDVHGQRR